MFFKRARHIWLNPSNACSVHTGPQVCSSLHLHIGAIIADPVLNTKFFMFFLLGSYGDTWFSTAFIDFKHIGRRDLVKYCDTVRANEQVICFSTLYIKSQYVPLFVIKLLPNPLPVHIQMMTSLNGCIFRLAGPLRGESTGHRLISLTKASDEALWYFLWYAPEQTVEETLGMPVIWDASLLIVASM